LLSYVTLDGIYVPHLRNGQFFSNEPIMSSVQQNAILLYDDPHLK